MPSGFYARQRKSVDVRFWSKVGNGPYSIQCGSSCREWKNVNNKNGYGRFGLYINGIWTVVRAHRVAWELTFGKIPSNLQVLHRCDNRKCCNPDHLFLGTPQDNVDDMIAKGHEGIYMKHGKENGRATLTEQEVFGIRYDFDNGMKVSDIVSKYCKSYGTIKHIVDRDRWKHI